MSEAIGVVCVLLFAGLIKAFAVYPPATSQDVAAWVQAVGSIGAVIAAIFVLNRQNAHALALLSESERRGLRRRTMAAMAIFERVAGELAAVCDILQKEDQSAHFARTYLLDPVLEETIRVVVAVPLHELGSYELVDGAQHLIAVLRDADSMVKRLGALDPGQFDPAVATNAAAIAKAGTAQAMARIHAAADKLIDE